MIGNQRKWCILNENPTLYLLTDTHHSAICPHTAYTLPNVNHQKSLTGLSSSKRTPECRAPSLLFMECWNIRSHDYSFPGTFVPSTVRSQELSFPRTNKPCRTFPPRTIRSFVSRAVPGPLTKKQRNKQKRRPLTATVHNRYTQTVDWRYSASRLNRFSSSERGLLNNSFGALQPSLYVHY